MTTKKKLPISSLKLTVYVRQHLDENRIRVLESLYNDKKEVPPVLVTPKTHQVVGGKHRIETHKRLGLKEIECVFTEREPKDKGELIAWALLDNEGGSLPPTWEDRINAIVGMRDEGNSHRQVHQLLDPTLGYILIKRLLDDADSRILKRQKRIAANLVREEEYTVPQAAKKAGITDAQVRMELGDKKVKPGYESISQILGRLGTLNSSYSQSLSNFWAQVQAYYKDGSMPAADVQKFLKRLDSQHSNRGKLISDYYARFNSIRK